MAYEWLHIRLKGSKGNPTLFSLFNHNKICYMQVGRVTPKGKYTNNVTGFILGGVTSGLFILILEDKGVKQSIELGLTED